MIKATFRQLLTTTSLPNSIEHTSVRLFCNATELDEDTALSWHLLDLRRLCN